MRFMVLLLFLLPQLAMAQPRAVELPANLQRGLVGRWVVTPPQQGGLTWYPRVGRDLGTLVNMATAGTSGWQPTVRPGGVGEIRFDGNNDTKVSLPPGGVVMNLPAFSVCLWFRATAGTYLYIEDTSGGCCANMGFIATEFTSAGTLDAANYDSSAVGWNINVTTTPAPLSGSWNHACAVQLSKSSAELYFNGVRVGTNGTTTGTTTPTFRNLGSSQNGAGAMTGALDDVCTWNRALSAAEVQQVYTQSAALPLQRVANFVTVLTPFVPPGVGRGSFLPFFTQP